MSILVSQAVVAQVAKSAATGVVTPPAAGTIPVADGAGTAQWLNAGGGSVTLASAGGGQSLVADGAGPVLTVRGLVAGTGVSAAAVGGDVVFANSSPASAVTLTSDGGAETLVASGAGPALHVKGLAAGAGIALAGATGAVTVANTSPATLVTLTSDGGAETLVAGGAGPGLHVKGLSPGVGISLAGAAGAVTVTNSGSAASVTLASDGGAETLVAAGAGPALHMKGLTAGAGVTLAGGAGAVTLTNTDLASTVTLASAGGAETLVAAGAGTALQVKGLSAGAGAVLVGSAAAVTVGTSAPLAGVLDSISVVAPFGQRDDWQNNAGTSSGPNTPLYNEYLGVAVCFAGSSSTAIVSTNQGVTWSPATFDVPPTSPGVFGYNSARTCVVGSTTSQTYTSVNGLNYTLGAPHPATSVPGTNVEWFSGAGLFVTGASNAGQRVMTSPDGVTWTLRTSAVEALTVKSSPSICVAVGSVAPFAQWSTDGVTWTPTASTITSCRALAWSADRGEFVCIGIGGSRTVYVSTDGKTWAPSGVNAPAVANDTLLWIAPTARYYYSSRDADANTSLYSSLSPYLPFVGAQVHLDGTDAHGPVVGLAYIASVPRFLIGISNSPKIAYSTPVLKLKAILDLIATCGAPVSVDKFSAYANVTVNNTSTETTISAPASFIGSYTFQTAQPLGMQWTSSLVFSVTSAAGDTLTVRYKIGAATLHTVAVAVPAAAAGLLIHLKCLATVRSATLELRSTLVVNGSAPVLAAGSGAYTRTATNVMSLTAKWNGSASSCTVADQLLQVAFMNGQP